MASDPVYDAIGHGYTTNRRPDPRWERVILEHLDSARRVLNVGAGTGSYEPTDRGVVAVEPSTVMLAQRRRGAAPAVRGSGLALPIRNGSFDAAMAILTVHHWDDWRAGLEELCRVAPRRIILAIDMEAHARFWLLEDYLPDVQAWVLSSHPTVSEIADTIPITETVALPLPHDLSDGVLGAQWRTPEAYLDPMVRANTSPIALADPAHVRDGMERLGADLASGAWHARHGHLLDLETYDLGYRLLVSDG